MTEYSTRHTYFANSDSKGRALGCVVHTWEREGKFWANTQATRAGHEYGATRGGKSFSNEADRESWVQKQVEGTRKRYSKPGIR